MNELDATMSKTASVAELVKAVRRYLLFGADEIPVIKAALATAVAYALEDEEPLWLVVVGPPGAMKTEIIRLFGDVAHAQPDEITRAGLLSWSRVGKTMKKAGLLTRVPTHAFCTIADFSTVITMGDREARGRIFAALRRIYDGALRRDIGGGGEDELEWEGHLTLLIASTPAIETHLSAESQLGERWLLSRLPEAEEEKSRKKAVYVANRDRVKAYRELAEQLTAQVVEEARKRIPEHLSEESVERLAAVATLCAFVRTGVPFEGQGKYRVVMGEVSPEEPTRLMGQVNRLARCLIALGETEEDAVELAWKAAMDSTPRTRMAALRHVIEAGDAGTSVKGLMASLDRANFYSSRWELEALEAISLVERVDAEDDEAYPTYVAKDAARSLWGRCTAVTVTPHIGGEGKEGGNTSEPPSSPCSSQNSAPATFSRNGGSGLVGGTLIDENGRCIRHPDEPQPWCLECQQTGAAA